MARTGFAIGTLTCLLVSFGASMVSHAQTDKSFKIWEETDKFKPGLVVIKSSFISIKEIQRKSHWFAYIDFRYVSYEETEGVFVFGLHYNGEEPFLWDELTLVANEVFARGELIDAPRREVMNGVEMEATYFRIPRDTVIQLLEEQRVDFRAAGRYRYEFYLNAIGIDNLRRLVAYVEEFDKKKAVNRRPPPPETDSNTPEGPATQTELPSYIRELKELQKLRDSGLLTEEEASELKAEILASRKNKEHAEEPE